MKHVPGRIHVGARKELSKVVVAMLSSMTEAAEDSTLAPITWGQVRDEVAKDKVSAMLCSQIVDGFPASRRTKYQLDCHKGRAL